MANTTTGKFWNLDTAGVVSINPVKIKDIKVTWKVASAGTIELTEVDREDGQGSSILYAQTLGASSAAVDQMTQIFPINNWVAGLTVKTITDVAKCVVNVE
jgi:hypothetical protein